jgi:hypothetical protein
MPAPEQSFKSEIAAYRRKWVANSPGEEIPEIVRKLLARWEKHPTTEKIWTELKEKLPPEAMLTAEEFIYLVIQRRVLMAEVKRENRERPTVMAEADARAKQQLQAGEYFQLVRENELRRQYQGIRDKLISRNARTAPRKLFENGWSEKFIELCGQPLDEVVAVLTYVAFGVERTPDMIRGMRKPTTKRDRDTRRRPVSR